VTNMNFQIWVVMVHINFVSTAFYSYS